MATVAAYGQTLARSRCALPRERARATDRFLEGGEDDVVSAEVDLEGGVMALGREHASSTSSSSWLPHPLGFWRDRR